MSSSTAVAGRHDEANAGIVEQLLVVGQPRVRAPEDRDLLERELRTLGLQYWPSRANFVLVRVGPAYAEFIQGLRARGILVRDRSFDPGCAGCVRMTVGSVVHTQTLIGALRDLIANLKGCLGGCRGKFPEAKP